jgi:hypothetical protein
MDVAPVFMHKPWKGFRYPFEKHALVHHHIFKGDATYHLVHEQDKRTIPMAWWSGPALVALCHAAVFYLGVFRAQVGSARRRGGGLHAVFHGLRIHALVHASAQGSGTWSVRGFSTG